MKILILEDDLTYIHIIFGVLFEIQKKHKEYYENIFEIDLHTSVNDNIKSSCYDLIILDRDASCGGSFHSVISFGDFYKCISISAVPEWNRLAKDKGCQHIIPKQFKNYGKWKNDLKKIILKKMKWIV